MPNASKSFRLLCIKWWDAGFPDIVGAVVYRSTRQFFAVRCALSATVS
jgi:hypothetical protein